MQPVRERQRLVLALQLAFAEGAVAPEGENIDLQRVPFKGHKIARLFDRAQRLVALGEERFKLRGRDLVLALNARYGGDARLFGIVIPRFIAAAGAADAAVPARR